jgi:hypothetical protein
LYDALLSLQEKVCTLAHLNLDETSKLKALRSTIVASRIGFNRPRGPATSLNEHQANTLWETWSVQASSGVASMDDSAKSYNHALFSALCGRALVVTNSDSLGIVDELVQDGDIVCAFPGGQVLLCIRPTDAKTDCKTYQLIGEW